MKLAYERMTGDGHLDFALRNKQDHVPITERDKRRMSLICFKVELRLLDSAELWSNYRAIFKIALFLKYSTIGGKHIAAAIEGCARITG